MRARLSTQPRVSLRQLRALLGLLAISLALPSGARADTGWSLERHAARRQAEGTRAQHATVAPVPPALPSALAAGGADGAAVAGTGGRGAREMRSREVPGGDAPPDHAAALLATRSRLEAVQRDFLRIAPSLAVATRGIVGFHTSPAPPLA